MPSQYVASAYSVLAVYVKRNLAILPDEVWVHFLGIRLDDWKDSLQEMIQVREVRKGRMPPTSICRIRELSRIPPIKMER